MARKRKRVKVRTTELILTPLIDCVLFLMTFLLLVTDFTRQDEFPDIQLPDISAAKPVEEPDPKRLVIMVKKTGKMYISGMPRTDTEVKDALAIEARISRENPTSQVSNRFVLIGADEEVPWTHIQKIVGWCTERQIGIWRLAFAMKPYQP